MRPLSILQPAHILFLVCLVSIGDVNFVINRKENRETTNNKKREDLLHRGEIHFCGFGFVFVVLFCGYFLLQYHNYSEGSVLWF